MHHNQDENSVAQKSPLSGMQAFTILWSGQFVSILGSAMSWFAFTIWAWQETGQATTLALVSFFAYFPPVLLSPVAGALVDRWDRRWVLVFSDFTLALGTLMVLLLYASDSLQIWHIYVIGLVAGAFNAFQYPAYAAAVTTMLPKEHYARAEGMLWLAQSASGILAPVLATAVLGLADIATVMVIDLVTFLAALGTLLWVRIPKPPVTDVGRESRGSLWQETLFGFRYIWRRDSLLGLALLFMAGNFFLSMGATLMAPMLLARSGDSESVLATVQSVGAVGGVVGGILLSLWGGPKRRIHGILLGGAGACSLGMAGLGLGWHTLTWGIGSFFFSFFEPLVKGGDLALWQAKVEADVQGRVFSARQLLVQIPYLVAMLVAGPLAEYWAEPMMQNQAGLSGLFGTGPGSGMALLMALAGVGGVVSFLSGYAFRAVRQVEALLPDQHPAAAAH